MTIHYHGTPITPRRTLYELAGRHFCVSFAHPQDAEVCHQIGQSVMLDNGAFSYWKRNGIQNTKRDWDAYYTFCERWFAFQTTWAVIPDVIQGTELENGLLIAEWFGRFHSYRQAAPVWHLHESIDYLDRLVSGFDRVCLGSSGEFAVIGTAGWNNRMNEAFTVICRGSGRPRSWIHMLRGMSLSGSVYPFASVDSTDIARNHEQKRDVRAMADRWDQVQCPSTWNGATQPALQFA